MRVARNTDGERKFQRNEWLSKSQIQEFFTACSQQTVDEQQELEDDDDHDDSLDEDEVAYERRGGCRENWTCSSYNT